MSLKQHARTLVALAAFGLFLGLVGCGDTGSTPPATTPAAGTTPPAGGAGGAGTTPGTTP